MCARNASFDFPAQEPSVAHVTVRLAATMTGLELPTLRGAALGFPAQLAYAPYVTIKLAALITGLTEKAIRHKIDDGKWIEGREFRRSPDGGIFISISGYTKWVESGGGRL